MSGPPGARIGIAVLGSCTVPSGADGLVLPLPQSHLRTRVLVNDTWITILPARGNVWAERWSDPPAVSPGRVPAPVAVQTSLTYRGSSASARPHSAEDEERNEAT